MKEICICAALRLRDKTCYIVRGHRHRDCLETIARKGIDSNPKLWEQGFITSHNRFVDRRDGFNLQQLQEIESANPEGYNSAGWLFSEDLY